MNLSHWLKSIEKSVSPRTRRSLLAQRSMRQHRLEQLESRQMLTTIDLASLTAAQGSTIFGADAGDDSGWSVSSAGDVNGDGFDDLLIGAEGAGGAGESYVIFGEASLPATIDLASLGSDGVTIFGADARDFSGRSVSSAGDVNGDGLSCEASQISAASRTWTRGACLESSRSIRFRPNGHSPAGPPDSTSM